MIPRDPADRAPLLSAAEEADLACRARAGDRAARDRLIEANIGLALALARAAARRSPWLGDDLEGEALVGLIAGVDRFDPTRGVRLTTYATYWIRQACRRHLLRHGGPVTIPVGLLDGSDAANPDLVAQARRVRGAGVLSGDEAARRVRSGAERPDEALARREEVALVAEECDRLADGTILRGWYGLGGAAEETGRALATRLGVTHQRIAQRRGRAEAALRGRLEARGITA